MRDPRRVAVVLPMEESHGRAVVRGLLRYISMHSPWQLHIEPRWSSPEAIVRIRMAISTWHADGVIAHLALKPLQGELLATAIPLVNTSGGAALPADVPTVKPDQRAVGRIAADYFVQKGYRHFGYVGDPYLSLSAEQMEGFVGRLRRRSLSCSCFVPQNHVDGVWDWVAEQPKLEDWLRRLPKPLAVQACYGERAVAVIHACERAGLKVPAEVAVMGTGNDELLCEAMHAPLSSIPLGGEQIGYKAAAMLDKLMRGQALRQRTVLVRPLPVVPRRSTDTFAVSDPDVRSAVQFMSDNAARGITIRDVVGHMAISRRVLERKFRAAIGRSPHSEIERLQIETACGLLLHTDWGIKTVAAKSGFSGPEVFAVVFRRRMGIPATKYRAQTRPDASVQVPFPVVRHRRRAKAAPGQPPPIATSTQSPVEQTST